MQTQPQTRYDIEAVLVKKSAMRKVGTSEDIDPDLDAAYIAETRATEETARKCAEQMFKKNQERLMWNCVTIQEEIFNKEDKTWEPTGEMKGYYEDGWRD